MRRLPPPPAGWTLQAALEAAGRHSVEGPTLLLIDAALGVPRSFLRAVQQRPGWSGARDFLGWLSIAGAHPEALAPVSTAAGWRLERPFFRVPPGAGGRTAFEAAAARESASLLRAQERDLDGKSAFIVSGIPGTVGAGTLALWSELVPLLPGARLFAIAPFEGRPAEVLQSGRVCLAELYPRACYAAALDDTEAPRPRQRLDKTVPACAHAGLDVLQRASWVRRLGVELHDLEAARDSEDALDALLAAAGLLRALLDGEPLYDEGAADPCAEGMIFGSGGLRIDQPWRACPCRAVP